MNEVFLRGKQQILYNYLPGRVIDFGNTATVAIIRSVSGEKYDQINIQVLLNKIKQQAKSWDELFRPGLEDRIFDDFSQFAIVDPNHVKAKVYPLVLWCENDGCNRLFDFSSQGLPKDNTCPKCKKKSLVQFRFVKAHQCGYLEEVKPPKCPKCHSDKDISVRGLLVFERFRDFRWYCNSCRAEVSFFGGYCPSCNWKKEERESNGDNQNVERDPRLLELLIFRANRQYYVHSTTLINIPKHDFDSLLASDNWHIITGAKYLNIPSVAQRKLKDISVAMATSTRGANRISIDDTTELIKKYKNGEISLDEMESEMKRMASQPSPELDLLKSELVKMSGLEDSFWKGSKFSILESVIPHEFANITSFAETPENEERTVAIEAMGVDDIHLISDFPIITASFGYSRLSYEPNQAWLRPFDSEGENKGKIPIFVDTVEADALYFQLDYDKVLRWLKINGMNPIIPHGTDPKAALKAYYIRLFSGIEIFRTVSNADREAKYVLGLIHTFAHLAIRRAEVLCGLERTSISEYLIPSTLSFAMYCNHRFGATIGALTSLFDQALLEWLQQIFDKRNCVYDPVCNDKTGSCHACTHLPETSCRHFNLNLGRFYLFGGVDPETGVRVSGYFSNNF